MQQIQIAKNVIRIYLTGQHTCQANIKPCDHETVILNIYFFDYDAVKVKISNEDIPFIISWLKLIKTAINLEYFDFSCFWTFLKCDLI